MHWSAYVPSIIAFLGIPAAIGLSWIKDRDLKRRQDRREDAIRREQQEREDRLARDRHNDWVTQQWWERKAEAYSRIVESL